MSHSPCVPPASGSYPHDAPRGATRRIIADVVTYYRIFGVSVESMLGAGSDRSTVAARGEAMLRMRIFLGMTLPQIGKVFGMSHSGVMWCISARFGRPHGRRMEAEEKAA